MTATIAQASATAASGASARSESDTTMQSFVLYAGIGALLGIVMVKSEIIFWHRIQEMFRFDSFHMYGVLGSALVTAFLSFQLLARIGARAHTGERVALAPKEMKPGHRYWIGGGLFGIGWALCGACPGPLFALIGTGRSVYVVTALAALAGTWTYGVLRPRLPH